MNTQRTAIVGDVHGQVARLDSLLQDFLDSGRNLVFVGDYVNRGCNSAGVLDLLSSAKGEFGSQIVLLRGNHDQAFLDVLDGAPIGPFLAMGGIPTVRSYIADVHGDVAKQLQAHVKSDHRELLANSHKEWHGFGLEVSHQLPADDTRPSQRERTGVVGAKSRIRHVVGHYVQRDRTPKVADGVAFIDTGCGTLTDGPLTALLLPEVRWFQY